MYYYKLKKIIVIILYFMLLYYCYCIVIIEIVTRSFDNNFNYLLFTYYSLTYSNLTLSRHVQLWITSELISRYLHHLVRYILG